MERLLYNGSKNVLCEYYIVDFLTMSDYIKYMDLNAIKLADLANEIGDYKVALEFYNKAWNRLSHYQGDRMSPLMMGVNLNNKIREMEKKLHERKSILRFDGWQMTKSSFVKGNQCFKYLYLDKHKKNEKTSVDKETQAKFNRGHEFEDSVRNEEFPEGINIKKQVGNFTYFNSYTKYLLDKPGELILYEATIIEDDVLIMCDVLVKSEDGFVDIYEIKHSTEANIAISTDLKLQYAVCKKRFKDKLRSFNLILRVEDETPNWKIENHINELKSQTTIVDDKIAELKKVLQGEEPTIAIGEHCTMPYKCEFIDYCKRNEKNNI